MKWNVGDIERGKGIGYSTDSKYILVNCVDCDITRWVPLQFFKKGYRTRCHKCANRLIHQSISLGEKYDKDGYKLVYLNKDNPFYGMAGRDHYVREHRLVMAKYLGRLLEKWEIVHHKNHIRDDNRLENLELVGIRQHQTITLLENRITYLENRVTLLEGENVLLREKLVKSE